MTNTTTATQTASDTEAATLEAVQNTSNAWIAAFNRGDADACAAAYTEDATMKAEPVAEVSGRDAIRDFWQGVLAGDPGTLRYEDPRIHVLDSQTAVLSSRWSMSRLGGGVITHELWKLQDDGVWRLTTDHFEIRQQGATSQP